jgi:hypothetical protein
LNNSPSRCSTATPPTAHRKKSSAVRRAHRLPAELGNSLHATRERLSIIGDRHLARRKWRSWGSNAHERPGFPGVDPSTPTGVLGRPWGLEEVAQSPGFPAFGPSAPKYAQERHSTSFNALVRTVPRGTGAGVRMSGSFRKSAPPRVPVPSARQPRCKAG